MRTGTHCLQVIVLGSWLTAALQADAKRLDGSTLSPLEIDRTVVRLMQAAEVTGVGVAILNGGRVT